MSVTRLESYVKIQETGEGARQRAAVLAYLSERPSGAHAQQVSNDLGLRLTSARARLTEMAQAKEIVEAGTVFNPESNRNVTLYKAKQHATSSTGS